MAMSMVLSLSIHPSKPLQKPNSISAQPNSLSRRLVFLIGSTLFLSQSPLLIPISADAHTNSSTFLSGIVNTKSWFQFYGDGFSIRVPPEFQDLTEPEVCFFPFFLFSFQQGFNLCSEEFYTLSML